MFRKHILGLALVACLLITAGCSSKPKLPEKGTQAYNDAVSSFYIGLAALQVGHDIYAEDKLSQLTKMVPNEPAGWANWGVLALRQRNYDPAGQRFSDRKSTRLNSSHR